MKKILMVLPLAAVACGAAALAAVTDARAGNYAVRQESDCQLVTAGELSQVVFKAGAASGLRLPDGMAIHAELHCSRDGDSQRFVYAIRAAIEKQLNDGDGQRWAPVAQLTGYGTTPNGAALLRQVHFTVRDVIRQEP
jgi:hypothetical protein